MNLDELLKQHGLYSDDHETYYKNAINFLGYDKIKKCVPYDINILIKSYDNGNNKYLNGNITPMKKWDIASGFNWNNNYQSARSAMIWSELTDIYRKNGITSWSNSTGVSLLKNCALMMIKEAINND